MKYIKEADLKVTCIANEDDFALFGITFDDLLERTQNGYYFLDKIKALAGQKQGIKWTNVAYTLQISMLPSQEVSLTFSEEIEDYIDNLKKSMGLAEGETKNVLKEFIHALETEDEESARTMVSHFENNIRKTKEKQD